MKDLVRCALIQACHDVPMSEPVDVIKGAALVKYTRMIDEAAAAGAKIVAMPELFSTPYFCTVTERRWYDSAEPVPDGPTVTQMRQLAARFRLVLIVPVYEQSAGQRFNSAAVIDADGSYLGVYRKHHVPTYHTGNYEPYYFHRPNLGFPVFQTAYARIGVSICYDRHFPEVARAYGVQGVQLLITPSATSGPQSERVWELEQQAHALANGFFLGALNRVGTGAPCDSSAFFGKSFVSDPGGEIIAQGRRQKEEVVLADLDLGETEAISERWHTARLFQDRRPSTYVGTRDARPSGAGENRTEGKRMTTTHRELRYKPIMTDEMKAAAVAALEDGRLIRSRYEEADSDGAGFEREVCAYMGKKYGVAVSSGWAAMHVAFLAAGIGPGDEVITVPNSFISVGDVVEIVGATRSSSTFRPIRSIWIPIVSRRRSPLGRKQSCLSTTMDSPARWVRSWRSPGSITSS
jgi:beta-ureidopropionase